MAEKTELRTFASETKTVNIAGGGYTVRELTLSEKIRVFAPISDQLKEAIKGGVESINLKHLLLSSAEVLDNLLALSVPDCKDWAIIPESAARDVLDKVLEVNDFGGFFVNFMGLVRKIIPSQKP